MRSVDVHSGATVPGVLSGDAVLGLDHDTGGHGQHVGPVERVARQLLRWTYEQSALDVELDEVDGETLGYHERTIDHVRRAPVGGELGTAAVPCDDPADRHPGAVDR